jgi:hypothetical protein
MRVTDVVDMDVALHGKRFIVGEFIFVTAVAVIIALVSTVEWARIYAALIAVNCATFAVLAAVRPRREAPDLKGVYLLTAFALALLFVPLYFPLAAIAQRRSHAQPLTR